ncbi:hypothetical protein C0991_008288 [Blastosporella zonata]|nr:hypothetical protein C0991_008288 [Blastosporella zonata]
MIGQILQLATILGGHSRLWQRLWAANFVRANLLHPKLIKSTCAVFSRTGWSECFASTIERELSLKPWSHSSSFEAPNWKEGVPSKFASDVRGNVAMRPYE